MSVFRLRLWAVVAAFLTLQAPVLFAVNAGPPKKKPRIDLQIQQIESNGHGSGEIRVIIRPDGTRDWASLLAALKARGITVTRQARRANAIALRLSQSDLSWLESLDGIGSIAGDPVVHPSQLSLPNGTNPLAPPQPNIANALRTQLGLTDGDAKGAGIGIAIVDSGIAAVPDLADRISGFYDFTNGQPAVPTAPVDGYGHGTHVAGLAAGSGGLSNGEFGGVAPQAHLIGLRVLDDSGAGSTSDVIAAIEFATANKAALGVDVLNLSLGHPPYGVAADDPLVQAVEAASRAGIIVVVSAGNAGVNPQTNQVGYAGIMSPGNAPSAFTVASAKTQNTVDPSDDRIANYSSRGPSWFDGFVKPDFAAPGQNVVAPFAPGSFLGVTYPSLLVNDAHGQKAYISLSGTSMAAGVESGLVAVVLETSRHTVESLGALTSTSPRLSGAAIKAFTEYTAFTMHDANNVVYDRLTQGAGRVNGQGVIELARSVNPTVPVGSPWIISAVVPYSTYNGVTYSWAENIIWGVGSPGTELEFAL